MILPGHVYVSIYREGRKLTMTVKHCPTDTCVTGEGENEQELKATLLEMLEERLKQS